MFEIFKLYLCFFCFTSLVFAKTACKEPPSHPAGMNGHIFSNISVRPHWWVQKNKFLEPLFVILWKPFSRHGFEMVHSAITYWCDVQKSSHLMLIVYKTSLKAVWLDSTHHFITSIEVKAEQATVVRWDKSAWKNKYRKIQLSTSTVKNYCGCAISIWHHSLQMNGMVYWHSNWSF